MSSEEQVSSSSASDDDYSHDVTGEESSQLSSMEDSLSPRVSCDEDSTSTQKRGARAYVDLQDLGSGDDDMFDDDDMVDVEGACHIDADSLMPHFSRLLHIPAQIPGFVFDIEFRTQAHWSRNRCREILVHEF